MPIGRVDEEKIRKYSDAKNDFYYICGPPGMVDALTQTLRELGVEEKRIKIEHFTGYK